MNNPPPPKDMKWIVGPAVGVMIAACGVLVNYGVTSARLDAASKSIDAQSNVPVLIANIEGRIKALEETTQKFGIMTNVPVQMASIEGRIKSLEETTQKFADTRDRLIGVENRLDGLRMILEEILRQISANRAPAPGRIR
jgi:hypothetical protein